MMSFCMSALSLDVNMNYNLVQYIETVTFIDIWCQLNKITKFWCLVLVSKASVSELNVKISVLGLTRY